MLEIWSNQGLEMRSGQGSRTRVRSRVKGQEKG